MEKLAEDSETINPPFFSKSKEVFPLSTSDIITLEKYRKSLDSQMITMNPKHQTRKAKLFNESQRVVNFLNNFYSKV